MKSFGIKISRGGLPQSIVTRLQSTASTATSSSQEIQIPVRKERGPTDLLQALERTINRDPTAAKYKYHDDPYLIPASNFEKRSYALAKESGRKTAMWIRQTHADLFQHRVADPVIEAFLPKAVYTSKEEVSEETLKNVIKQGHKSDALTIYELLEENVSNETKQALLELLCYYNDNEKFSEELLEEKWFRREEVFNSWKNCPVITKLFAMLSKEDEATAAKAYNAVICGLTKCMKAEQAWDLFLEAEGKGYPIALTTYNEIIAILSYLKNNTKERREILKEILLKITAAGLEPNINTFNNSLKLAAALYNHEGAIEFCRDIFTEFKAIGIQPSLGSYYYALVIFYKKAESNLQRTNLLREIMTDLSQRKKLTIEDSADMRFFKTIMEIATTYSEDPLLPDAIHKLLLKDDNYRFINDGYRESLYYRNYLKFQINNNPLEQFIKLYYDSLVPHVYTPEPIIMDELLKVVNANAPEIGLPFLPRLWSHLVQFGYVERRDLVSKALTLMRTHCVPPKNSPIHAMYGDAAWTVWEFVTSQRTKKLQEIKWTGPILGDVAVLCLRAGALEKWMTIINFMYAEQNSIIGPLLSEQIDELFEACLLNGYSQPALDLIHYCSDMGVENVPTMAQKIYMNLPLLNHQETRLKGLVDPVILKNLQSSQ